MIIINGYSDDDDDMMMTMKMHILLMVQIQVSDQENAAAVRIQSVSRGYLARRHVMRVR